MDNIYFLILILILKWSLSTSSNKKSPDIKISFRQDLKIKKVSSLIVLLKKINILIPKLHHHYWYLTTILVNSSKVQSDTLSQKYKIHNLSLFVKPFISCILTLSIELYQVLEIENPILKIFFELKKEKSKN